MLEIKKCPHCGSSCKIIQKQNIHGRFIVFIQCNYCRAQSACYTYADPEYSETYTQKAIDNWNRRATENTNGESI